MKWVIGIFLLMILGVMSYLFIIGMWLDQPLPFFTGLAFELGITVHDLGIATALVIMVGLAFIGIPLLIVVIRMAE